MANRVLIGRHPALSGNPYGMWVSKDGSPAANVLGTTDSDFAFRTDLVDTQSNVTSLNGQSLIVKYKGATAVNFDATGTGKNYQTVMLKEWDRSDFNDGTLDRCPLCFVQTTVVTDTAIQNAVGYYWFKNTSTDFRVTQGFKWNCFPYYSATKGRLYATMNAEWFCHANGDDKSTDTGTRYIYWAIASATINSVQGL